jgi:hypothetical protein
MVLLSGAQRISASVDGVNDDRAVHVVMHRVSTDGTEVRGFASIDSSDG